MGHEPAVDHLELWRGIDDAVWREALRRVPPAARLLSLVAAERRPNEERAPEPARRKERVPA